MRALLATCTYLNTLNYIYCICVNKIRVFIQSYGAMLCHLGDNGRDRSVRCKTADANDDIDNTTKLGMSTNFPQSAMSCCLWHILPLLQHMN